MAGGSLKNWLALGATVLIAMLLAGCGDDEPSATGAQTSAAEQTSTPTTTEETVDDRSDVPAQIRSNVKTGPLHVTNKGSDQFRDISYYTSLQHGQQSSTPALEQAARVVHDYRVAHVTYDWATSCSLLDEHALGEVTILGSHFEDVAGKDCPTIIAKLLGKVPARETYVSSEVDAGTLRVRREGGYLFWRAGGNPYTVNLSRDEDGNWRLSSILVLKLDRNPS